jgi:hypothetical protein
VSSKSVQTLLAAIISFVLLISVYRLGRKQKLSFRYTVGWMFLGLLGLVAGLVSPFAEPLAETLKITPSALIGVGAIVLLVTLCVQLSISISGLQEQIRLLAEEASFLRHKIDSVSTRQNDGSSSTKMSERDSFDA